MDHVTTGINIALNRKKLIALPHSSPEIAVTVPTRSIFVFASEDKEFRQDRVEKSPLNFQELPPFLKADGHLKYPPESMGKYSINPLKKHYTLLKNSAIIIEK